MIKIEVTSERHGNAITVMNKGKVGGKREMVAAEMTAVLKEFHSIDDGETLSIAFAAMLEDLTNDTLEGNKHD